MSTTLTVRMAVLGNAIVWTIFGCIVPESAWTQVTEPIPPATTPGTVISNLTSAVGFVRAKASADECWAGLGQNTKYAFLNLQTPDLPCSGTQIPKVDQG